MVGISQFLGDVSNEHTSEHYKMSPQEYSRLGWIYSPSWVFIFLTRFPLLPPQWAICLFLVLSYPNQLKNKTNLGDAGGLHGGLTFFSLEPNLATISCPGRQPYTDRLLRD